MNEETVPTPLSSAGRKAWRALYEAHALVTRRIERDLTAIGGGSLSDYGVLFTLSNAPGGRVRLSELADAAMMSRSGATRLVNRLEEGGFLERIACDTDKRGMFAVLTEAGRGEMRRIWAVYS
ncbi:MAG: MarR family transcriptional regulator, partial [Armatimonadetes bacterium]|nr:MarR family transcriptional regulator [Armatimonadota bacterium]